MKKRALLLILIPVSFFLTMFAKHNIGFAEFYALKVYPVFSQSISFLTSKLKISLAEILIITLIVAAVLYFIVVAIKTVETKSFVHIKEFILNVTSFLSVIYFLFVLFCGINYYRNEFTIYSELKLKESSAQDLIELCEILISDANDKRELLINGDNGVAKLFDADYMETAKRAKIAMDITSQKYKVLEGRYPAPKIVHLSKYMSHMRITGVFFPFTFEANVNVHIPEYQVPSTMLHELVHLRGFMREDEANFISYLACIKSGYDDFYYSGTMLALSYAMNALYYEDYDAFTRLYGTYSDDVKNDLNYSSSYWKQFETKVAEISNKVNDSYLKANNQTDGVKSYGRMVDLLLAYYN
jgi:hypothetical protein